MLSQMLRAAAGVGPSTLAIAETHEATITADGNSFSFTSCSFGTATSDRYIVVAISAYSGTNGSNINTATIGGISATLLGATNNSGVATAIAYVKVTSGTTGTVAFNLTDGENAVITVFRVTGANTITTGQSLSSTNTGNASLTCGTGAVLVSAARGGSNDTAISASWTGSSVAQSGTVETRPFGHSVGSTDSASLTVSRSATGTSSARCWSYASFIPA